MGWAESVAQMSAQELLGCLLFVLPVFKNKAKAIVAENKRKGHGDGTLGMLSWLIVAVLDGSLNVLITNPIWVLVTRMQDASLAIPLLSPVLVPMAQSIGPLLSQIASSPWLEVCQQIN
ncbi:peroxisomal nicotinamide adenine dinucleotide carrier-like [Henckelia pumila]|uniref:peroxisomal nicotinamide adenine dinucleotide carrier-like n=1 Tax=Henckelia pumila TaxID=405737 RepID=UPI003C6E2020